MRAPRLAALAAVAGLCLGGCISVGLAGGDEKRPAVRRHVVDTAAGVTSRASARSATVGGLAVRPFGGRSRYEIRVATRDASDNLAYLEYQRWSEPPADAATDAVREGLASSGAFAFVSAAGDALEVDRYLDGYVLAFDLETPSSGPWKARFSARLSLSDRGGKLLATNVYEATKDLPGADPAGLGKAMSAAIGDAINRALTDWTAAGVLK